MMRPNSDTVQQTRNDLELNEFLPYRINLLGRLISDSLSNIYRETFDISVAQWRVLVWLNRYNNLYAKDLSAYTHMDKTQVSRLIRQLEQRGFVSRQIGEADQRYQLLSLTEAGKTLLDELIPQALKWEKRLLASLSIREYQQLTAIIEKLKVQIDSMNDD